MEETIIIRKLGIFPIAQCLILIFGGIACFIIAYVNQDVSPYLPFISETGAEVPEMCLFSLSLITSSFLGSIFILIQFLIQHPVSTVENKLLKILNLTSLTFGLFSMVGLAGVAAFPVSTVFSVHLLFAGIHFVSMSCYMFLLTYFEYRVDPASKLMKFHRLLSILFLFSCIMMISTFLTSLKQWHMYNTKLPAMKVPADKGFDLVLTASFFEWLSYGCILLFFLSFFFQFQKYELHIRIRPYGFKKETPVLEPEAL